MLRYRTVFKVQTVVPDFGYTATSTCDLGGMEPLDASYALLSDVNARNRALQSRLRSSLPLLWTNNALVMTSAAPRRRRGRQTKFEESAVGEADQLLSTLQEASSLQVSRRYKRRVEWEVARRIARVDRELQQYPPAQRFWNQTRKEATPASLTSRQLQRHQNVERRIARKSGEVNAVRKVGEKTQSATQHEKFWVKPENTVKKDTVKEKVMKNVGTSPRRVAGEKENATPNVPPGVDFGTKSPEKSSFEREANVTKPDDNRDVIEGEKNNKRIEKEVILDQSTKDAVLSPLHESSSDDFHTVRSISVEDVQETDAVETAHEDSDAEDTIMDEDLTSYRVKTHTERPSSSIGRQVLSEFRTMPSVASFGAPPVLSSGVLGKPGDMRLNGEVLRRLFGDLDADKDGHVNRIETCMALHRLQISVPTTRIISFFRHIHSAADGKRLRSRNKQHLPMSEVINYKEFVAFVTAAYDQQQQRKVQRSRAFTRDKVSNQSYSLEPPLLVPSTSLPIFSQSTTTPSVKRRGRSPQVQRTDRDVPIYEVDDAEEKVPAFEERVMKEIPELLVNRMLADSPDAANQNAVSVVRKSLELLVGKEAVDEKLVSEITQELLRERLRATGSFNQDGTDDVTGLRKAAAYYNEQMLHGDAELTSIGEDANFENSVSWVDVLTEEKVSGLVQQIWKDKQMSLSQAPLEAAEDMRNELSPADISEDHSVECVDESTDTHEVLAAPPVISEKESQVSDAGDAIELNETGAAGILKEIPIEATDLPTSNVRSQPEHFAKTHLFRALDPYLRDSNDPHGVLDKATSIHILQRLRQERRAHQCKRDEQYVLAVDPLAANPNQESSVSARGAQLNTNINLVRSESLFSWEGEDESQSVCSGQHVGSQHESDRLTPTSEPVILREKTLGVNDCASNEGSSNLMTRSISVSSSSLSSTSDYQSMFGMHREVNRHLRARSVRRRPQRRRTSVSASGSSVPDSICSAELSDGEISREQALDLSDGEVFGDCKRKYFKQNDTKARMMKSASDNDSLLSSVESGELPVLVLAQSSSSVESGEVEDGLISE